MLVQNIRYVYLKNDFNALLENNQSVYIIL